MTLLLALSKNLVISTDATVTGAYRALGVEPISSPSSDATAPVDEYAVADARLPHPLGIIGSGEIGTETAAARPWHEGDSQQAHPPARQRGTGREVTHAEQMTLQAWRTPRCSPPPSTPRPKA